LIIDHFQKRNSQTQKLTNFPMYSHKIQIRVRYAETDQMGYLYYGNYAQYYEVGRVEAMRSLGMSYKEMEGSGIMMPVLDLQSTFVKPAYYDELLSITTSIPKMPEVRMFFNYEICNEQGDTINYGKTTLIFFDMKKRKPCRVPEELSSKLIPFY
jgi:acyl-CoA thioester hydrolase